MTVIGAGRGPAGRVLHSLFVKQEVCFVLYFLFDFKDMTEYVSHRQAFNKSVAFLWYCSYKDLDPLRIRMTPVHNHG